MSLFRDQQLPVSPFSDAYWKAELKAYGLRKSRYVVEHVSIDWFTIQGRCDDYLNVNMRFDDTSLPRLGINGHLWMSLTPMEIQSAALAIFRAKGVVATGGLGLGYFALRVAAKPEVTKVIVFESEPLLIEWFKRMFKARPELAKIEFVEGDVRKLFKGYTVNFAFMDVYDDMLPEAIIKDARLFRRKNKIGRYHFWGYEKIVLELLANKMFKYGGLLIGGDLNSYFKHWMTTPYGEAGSGMLSDYGRIELPIKFLRRARSILADFPV